MSQQLAPRGVSRRAPRSVATREKRTSRAKGCQQKAPPLTLSGCRRSKPFALRAASFDDLVGRGQHSFRDGEAERLGRLEVYAELEANRRLNGQVRRLGALKNEVSITRGAPPQIAEIRRIGCKPAHIGII